MRTLQIARSALLLVAAVATVDAAMAQATHPRQGRTATSRAAGVNLTLCKMAYDTETSTVIPPDDSTSDNPAAISVTFTKDCVGNVIARFTSEVTVPNSADFVHLDFRATCLTNGGFAGGCTPGSQFFASPGHTFFATGPAAVHVSTVQEVWPALQKGRWKFEVLPGGNNNGNLQFRTLVVEAFQN